MFDRPRIRPSNALSEQSQPKLTFSALIDSLEINARLCCTQFPVLRDARLGCVLARDEVPPGWRPTCHLVSTELLHVPFAFVRTVLALEFPGRCLLREVIDRDVDDRPEGGDHGSEPFLAEFGVWAPVRVFENNSFSHIHCWSVVGKEKRESPAHHVESEFDWWCF